MVSYVQPTTCKKIVTEVDTTWRLLRSQCSASAQANGMKGAVCLRWFKFNHSDVGTECKGNLEIATQILSGNQYCQSWGGSVFRINELVIRVVILIITEAAHEARIHRKFFFICAAG